MVAADFTEEVVGLMVGRVTTMSLFLRIRLRPRCCHSSEQECSLSPAPSDVLCEESSYGSQQSGKPQAP